MKNFFNKLTFLLTLSLSLVLTSCNTAGGGALTGAMFGGIIGSSIGGIGGGYRGSNVGTLVGMAVGAGTGAAIGAAAESREREAEAEYRRGERESVREHYRSLGINAKPDDNDDVYGAPRHSNDDGGSGYSAEPIYDDRIDFDATPNDKITAKTDSTRIPPAVVEVSESGATITTPVVISNARFINNDNTTHIAKGELVKVSFEVRNASDKNLYGIVPTVTETTGNKHLLISPSTLIENLGSHKAIRYTAYISAEQSLKKGTAHFQICVMSAGKQLSNVIEFDVELN